MPVRQAVSAAKSEQKTSDRSAPIADRIVGCVILAYAIWTICVHAVSFFHGSFSILLKLLPAVALAAFAAGVWMVRCPSDDARAVGSRVATGLPSARQKACILVAALAWVSVYVMTGRYGLFWWGSVAWLFAVMAALPKPLPAEPGVADPGGPARYILPGLVLAAALIVSVASRPDFDDAFYVSVPATLLRFPGQPIMLHDTLYRHADWPIQLVAYREHSYEVFVGVVAWLLHVEPFVAAHVVLPPLAMMFAVLVWSRLLRTLVPSWWPTALAWMFICMLLLGEVHHAYGNFAFVRIFQGKAILLCCMVPAVIWTGLNYARSGRPRDWILLCAAQISAIGITSSGLFIAPLAACAALAGAAAMNRQGLQRLVWGGLASGYALLVAAVLAFASHGHHAWLADTAMPSMSEVVAETFGRWGTLSLFVAMLASWAVCESPLAARALAGMSLVFLLCGFNPYLNGWIASHVMGRSAFWRLSWAVPLPFMLAILLGWLWRVVTERRNVAFKLSAAALVASALALGMSEIGTLRAGNGVHFGWPGVKAVRGDFAVAGFVANELPESSVVLAPEPVAVWCAGFVRHPQLLGVRLLYLGMLTGELDGAEIERRSRLMAYVGGSGRTDASPAILEGALRGYPLQGVVVARFAGWHEEMAHTLGAEGFKPGFVGDNYEVWVRKSP